MADSEYKQPQINDLISLREASQISGLTQPHLAFLIRQGNLWGKKIGRNWVTTAQAVNDYLAKGIKRGPKERKSQPHN
jgi:hypothetical protein